MITKIGLGAGDIWSYLEEHESVKFSELAEKIDRPRELLLMSLGWLAREGHVILRKEGEDYRVKLRKRKKKS
ncbi:MAG: winged helix-turn-helix domain-containing protein [Candidatus Omnitrophica bacterium]|nr:winged helix-turn-helix domain-containing protein [Candidatus Omnitrophota bacterium]